MSHPIIVTVTGNTVDEIRDNLLKLACEFGFDDKQIQMPLQTPPIPKEEKRGPGRPAKNAKPEKTEGAPAAESAAPPKEVKTEAPAAVKVATKEQLTEALQELNSTLNLQAVRDTLAKFGLNKASDAKESDYAAIIAECKKQTASAGTSADALL